VLFNDAGTPRLGVINCCNLNATTGVGSIYPLYEADAYNSTALSSSSTLAGAFYTTVAVSAKSFRILGYVEWSSSGIASAGTWMTTNLNRIRTFGPGVKTPGEVIGTSYNTGSGSSSSSGYVNCCQVSINIQSAANIIRVLFSGTCQVLAGGSGTNSQGTLRMVRGASTVIGMNANFSVGSAAGTNMQILCPGTLGGYDVPNTTGSLTYSGQVASTGAAAQATWGTINATLDEIMT
jgi:hypothetical protein